ncbi:TPA: hypothetical protein ACKQGZ_001026 [Serratia marcescens]|nr:hypothetical protein [Serratia marcescens]EIM8480862.1 hypothetical protein [Serratia marcescens]EIU9509766.1 hypothetical protein [Serratia marcescens]EIV5187693.1 hypothetical protein [Serratia marcescens]MBH2621388.1 hypothetical protein [Serratia marcescens]MBI6198534.1 hypothetical protein [Serratia marcescens]
MRISGKRAALLLCLAGAVTLLSGCEGGKRPVSVTKQTVAQDIEKTQAAKEAERMAQCQKELEALKGINPGQHKTYRQEFDRLMSGAAQYAGLRTRVNSETQDTVDALYRYKVSRLCADITQATLTGLADRGERLQ